MRYDLVIVGMGSGGIVAAQLARTLGLRVAAVERARVGGDCLWTGCVPSKALLATAKAAATMRHADSYGLEPGLLEVDTARVWARLHEVREEIARSDDDPERFRALGVDLFWGAARLAEPNVVEVGSHRLETRYALLCTGSRPAIPRVPGLEEAGFLTSETVFDLRRGPRSALFVGGGPIGVELAQAFARLGIPATLLTSGRTILPRDEPELAARLGERLRADGVDLHVGVAVERVEPRGEAKVVHGRVGGEAREWSAHEVLVAAGRCPNVEGLELARAGVEVSEHGVVVDAGLRTSAPWVYAAGDVAGRHHFTHAAAHEAARAVRNMFVPGVDARAEAVPWCTFTDPELAHAGLTAAEARERHGSDPVEVWRQDLDHSDRARAEGHTEGGVVIVCVRGRIVGAHVLAPGAGELIHELALAMRQKLKLTDLAGLVHVYPTIATSVAQLSARAAFRGSRRYGPVARAASLLLDRAAARPG